VVGNTSPDLNSDVRDCIVVLTVDLNLRTLPLVSNRKILRDLGDSSANVRCRSYFFADELKIIIAKLIDAADRMTGSQDSMGL
jgi:hypothetical protein